MVLGFIFIALATYINKLQIGAILYTGSDPKTLINLYDNDCRLVLKDDTAIWLFVFKLVSPNMIHFSSFQSSFTY